MEFYKNLYIGDTVKNPDKIKRRLKQRKMLKGIFVIAYAEKTRQLEIHNSIFLGQWYYKENPPYVIGIAKGQQEAFGLVKKITEEAVAATGKADLVEYLFYGKEGETAP